MMINGYVVYEHDLLIQYVQDPEIYGVADGQKFDFEQYETLLAAEIRKKYPQVESIMFEPSLLLRVITPDETIDEDEIRFLLAEFPTWDHKELYR